MAAPGTSAGPASIPVIEIAPGGRWRAIQLGELIRARELLLMLAERDLKVRYRHTLLGAAWVMGQPLLSMIIFTFIFHRLARFQAEGGVPYALFVLAGLLPWGFFAAGVQNAGNSLVGSSHLISKVYFPRLLVPTASVIVGLVDLAVGGVLLVGAMVWYAVVPGPGLILALVPVAVLLTLTLAVGLWLSALNVRYRDVRVLIPFLLQVWMFATPVVYPLRVLPERLRPLAWLNPITAVVEAFRACVLGGLVPWGALGLSAVAAALLLVGGAYAFRSMERDFADVL